MVYTPDAGYVGHDRFEYTIMDGNGTEDSGVVVVELLPAGATNSAPVGTVDFAETGPATPVTVEVLLNDVDPERDGLRIGSFAPPADPTVGEVTETVGLSGQPALKFVPAVGFEGTAMFSYRPVDLLGGQGEDIEVSVDVAASGAPNREPVARPDAVPRPPEQIGPSAGAGERHRSRRRRHDPDRGDAAPARARRPRAGAAIAARGPHGRGRSPAVRVRAVRWARWFGAGVGAGRRDR